MDSSIIHADIFFFITTVVIIVIGVLVAIGLMYLVMILRTISQVSKKVQEESDEIIADIKQLRGNIKMQGFKFQYVKHIAQMIFGMGKRKRAKKEKEESN